jgi:hypothetical protein
MRAARSPRLSGDGVITSAIWRRWWGSGLEIIKRKTNAYWGLRLQQSWNCLRALAIEKSQECPNGLFSSPCLLGCIVPSIAGVSGSGGLGVIA